MLAHSWFFFSVAATILFGISSAFFKLPSIKNQDRLATVLWILITQTALALLFFLRPATHFTLETVSTGALWGVTFSILTILQMYALTLAETNIVFPVTTTGSLIITIIAGILLFHESPSIVQWLGIFLAIATIFFFLTKGKRLQYSKHALFIGCAIMAVSAFNKLVQKFATNHFDIGAYQIAQYATGIIFITALYLITHRKNWRIHLSVDALKIGSLIGALSFLGGYSILTALTKGPFSLITAIHSTYTFITALVAAFIFKEKLTAKKIGLICLAILAVIIIRLG